MCFQSLGFGGVSINGLCAVRCVGIVWVMLRVRTSNTVENQGVVGTVRE